MLQHNTDAMITRALSAVFTAPSKWSVALVKWVKTQSYTCTHIKILLKHMNTPNTNFQTQGGTFNRVPWTDRGGYIPHYKLVIIHEHLKAQIKD